MNEVGLKIGKLNSENDLVLIFENFDHDKHMLIISSNKTKLYKEEVNVAGIAKIDRSNFNDTDKIMVTVIDKDTLTLQLGKKITISRK